jgi:ribosomal protein L2
MVHNPKTSGKGVIVGLRICVIERKDGRTPRPRRDGAGGRRSRSRTQSTTALAISVLRAMTVKPGNVLPLRLIPTGTVVHNLALSPQGPARLVRSAGTFAQIVSHEDVGKYTHVRLQSGEVRKVLQDCVATIGKVSNPLWKNRVLGKAGRNRWLGHKLMSVVWP